MVTDAASIGRRMLGSMSSSSSEANWISWKAHSPVRNESSPALPMSSSSMSRRPIRRASAMASRSSSTAARGSRMARLRLSATSARASHAGRSCSTASRRAASTRAMPSTGRAAFESRRPL